MDRLLRIVGRVPRRVLTIATIALGLVLCTPALGVGLVADDLLQELFFRDKPGIDGISRRPFDLFRFASGDPAVARKLMNAGIFPWWADPRAILAFFRPLSCATHWIDHELWPSRPWLMHAQSLLWFGVLLAIVSALYRRFARGGGAAALALFFYAVDDAHGPVVAWLANRNMIIALVFSMPSLIVHDRWRRDGYARGIWLAPALLAIGLCAGEAAVAVFGYIVAYACFLDRGPTRSRLASLVPYALVIAAWRVCYSHLGYGSYGSGLYVDPGRQPLSFIEIASTRLPILLLGQFALPWADLWEMYPLVAPLVRPAVMGLALLVLGALVLVMVPIWRRSALARFWSLGCVLAAIPSCATFPHDRLLLGSGVGAMAVVAQLIATFAFDAAASFPARAMTLGLACVHGVLGPLLLPYRAYAVGEPNRLFTAADDTIPCTEAVAERTLIMVNPPIDPFAAYFSIYREAALRSRPRALLWLTTGVSAIDIRGVDDHTLSVRPTTGFWSSSSQLMLRSLAHPLERGAVVSLDAGEIQVTDLTPDGRPLEVRVHFHKALSDPSLLWVQWGAHGYVAFRPPSPDTRIRVPAVDMAKAFVLGS